MFRFLGALILAATASSAQERPPAVAGQVTFLYFNDLAKADAFYGDILGLEKELDLEWVKIYKLFADVVGGARQRDPRGSPAIGG